MTPQLELALAAIAPLSPSERQQLLHLLTRDTAVPPEDDLETRSLKFWQGISLDHLLSKQAPVTVHNLEDFAADFWPEADEIEPFLQFLNQQRHAAR